MARQGLLVVITGPSAVGKGTIVDAILAEHPEIAYSVSATTRPKRPQETDGVEYYFVSREQFEEMIQNDELLEWAEVYGNYYGTPRAMVDRVLAEGRDLIVDVDLKGARFVRERFPGAVSVFVVPPSVAELEVRIRRRGTESEEAIQRRLGQVPVWLAEGLSYQYVLVNDQLDESVRQLMAIMQAEKCRTERRGGQLIRSLLDKGVLEA